MLPSIMDARMSITKLSSRSPYGTPTRYRRPAAGSGMHHAPSKDEGIRTRRYTPMTPESINEDLRFEIGHRFDHRGDRVVDGRGGESWESRETFVSRDFDASSRGLSGRLSGKRADDSDTSLGHKRRRLLLDAADAEALPRRGNRAREVDGGLAPQDALLHVGSWCDPSPQRPARLSTEVDSYSGHRARGRMVESRGRASSGDSRLATPDLAPLSSDFVFCSCCDDDEEDMINETWYLAGRAKMDAQRETPPSIPPAAGRNLRLLTTSSRECNGVHRRHDHWRNPKTRMTVTHA